MSSIKNISSPDEAPMHGDKVEYVIGGARIRKQYHEPTKAPALTVPSYSVQQFKRLLGDAVIVELIALDDVKADKILQELLHVQFIDCGSARVLAALAFMVLSTSLTQADVDAICEPR